VIQSFKAFVVGDEHCGFRVVEGVLEFGWRPPRIDANDNCADADGGPITDNPLGVVPHCNRYSTAVVYAMRNEVRSQLAHLRVHLAVRVALVFVHQVVLLGMPC